MPINPEFFGSIITSLVRQTRHYLANETGIEVLDVRRASEHLDQLELQQSTAIIGVSGNAAMLVAFSLSPDVANAIYDSLTKDIKIPPEDEIQCRSNTVSEMANVIVGNCTKDFSLDGNRVSISPPAVLHAAKRIRRTKNAALAAVSMITTRGSFDIIVFGPLDSLDNQQSRAH
jgi:CheY-specific phosphatase CheX